MIKNNLDVPSKQGTAERVLFFAMRALYYVINHEYTLFAHFSMLIQSFFSSFFLHTPSP